MFFYKSIICGILVLAIAASGCGINREVLFDFEDPNFALVEYFGCEVQIVEGRLRGEVLPHVPGVFMIFPERQVQAPVRLTMRAKTSPPSFGRGEIYWITEEDGDYGRDKFLRFPISHDGEWHEYDIPLPVRGTLKQFRVALGWKPGTFEIDWIQLRPESWPAEVRVARQNLPPCIALENQSVRLTLEPKRHVYTLTDKDSGQIWTADASQEMALVTEVEQAGKESWTLRLYDYSTHGYYRCRVALEERKVSFELDSENRENPFYGPSNFPVPFQREMERGKILFNDRSCGVYIDQTDKQYRGALLQVYGNINCTDMPWVGFMDEARGDGVMMLAETPYDAFFHMDTVDDERIVPRVIWEESMDSFRYPRRFSYHFVSDGGYVALARAYRKVAEDAGLVVPLIEKSERKPTVNLMPGAPVIWGDLDAWDFVREARTLGLRRGLISNAHHNLRDDLSLRKLNRMGYITLPYDSFSDALEGEPGFNSDRQEETAVHLRPGLGPAQGWQDELHSYFTRSSPFGLRALKNDVPESLERYGFNGRFIDVTMAWMPMEDWHPQHTFDRRQDIVYRKRGFNYLDKMGLVLGIEHGNDWGLPYIEYTEGSMSGPFWWLQAGPGQYVTEFRSVRSRDEYKDAFLEYNHGYEHRIPLWQLVYHDCTVSTWYWLDGPGIHYDAAPEIAERRDLFNLLYGGVPVMWRSVKVGFDWSHNRERFMDSYFDSCLFHEQTAFAKMTEHRFLTDDKSLQMSRFDSGHEVVVNFSEESVACTTRDGRNVSLAPAGYWAEGPDFHQSRVVEKGEVLKRIEAPGFYLYQCETRRKMGPVEMSGQFVAFEDRKDRWQLSLRPGHNYRFRPTDLTGWDVTTPFSLLLLDKLGQPVRVIQGDVANNPVEISATEAERYFALEAGPQGGRLLVYPPEDWVQVDEPVYLSCVGADLEIRYTLDGSEPSPESALYEAPLFLANSGPLRAQVFKGQAILSARFDRYFHVTLPLYDSDVMRGGDESREVVVPLEGLSRLRLRQFDGGDHCWSDWGVWGEAAFVDADGEKTYLSDLEPVWSIQTYETMGRDQNADGAPLVILGETYQKGLSTFSEADLCFVIPDGAKTFQATVGVDDRSNPGPGEPEILRGTMQFVVEGVVPGQAERPIRLELIAVEEVTLSDPDDLKPGEIEHLPPIGFTIQAEPYAGLVEFRVPETLISSWGMHFIDHIQGGEGAPRPLDFLEEWPEWKKDPRDGRLHYDKWTSAGLQFGFTALPRWDTVDLEFRVTNRADKPIQFVSGNMCLNFKDVPALKQSWELDKLYIAFDGALRPMSQTTPTPAEKGTEYPWLNFLTRRGLTSQRGPRDLPLSWVVDQVPDPVNLMAVESEDGKNLVAYTWLQQPDYMMSNCGYPCLHTGTAPSPLLKSGESYHWVGRVYFVENDSHALLQRVQQDRRNWAAQNHLIR